MNKHGGYTGELSDILDFSININPLGMPRGIKEKMIEALDEIAKYPEIDGKTAKENITRSLGVSFDNIILGNGATELIYLFARGIKKEKAVIITPTFNEYKRALLQSGWEVAEFCVKEKNDFTIIPEDLKNFILKEKPSCVFLCNPNNPTGKVYSSEFIEKLIQESSPSIIWFIDESFIEFSQEKSCIELVEKYSIILLRSLTKFFGLPGIRLGYAIANAAIIKKMAMVKEPWTLNTLALKAAENIYDDKAYIEKSKAYIVAERQRVFLRLKSMNNLKVYQSGGDFHLVKIENNTAEALCEKLLKDKINIRTCDDFTGLENYFFRIAIKSQRDNDCLLRGLKRIVEE